MTALVSIVGSMTATYGGELIGWYRAGQGAGWNGSIIGAFMVLWVYLKVNSKA